jgi:hypothetical protein
VQAAKENVKTWVFESHTPMNFEIKFRYRLLAYHCGPEPDSEEKESVLLQLPTYVELTATLPMICDPAVVVE